MKIVFYLLTAFFGLIGVLGILRAVELLLTGAGVSPVQVLIAIIALILAVACLRKARSA
jgi:anaerobic C4-dicarboxylate transporter